MKTIRKPRRWNRCFGRRRPADRSRVLPRIEPLCLLALLAGFLLLPPAQGQTVTQNLRLQPGWNAVFLEVVPADASPGAVLKDLPVESVWTRAEDVVSAEFIQDPSEAAFTQSGWLSWFPPTRPESFLSQLKVLQANRPYLVKLGGTTTVDLQVSGTPSYRRSAWVPDTYTLLGVSAETETPPTFREFFAASSAHYDPATGATSFVAYRLSGGQWSRVGFDEPIQRGAAYWIYTRGASEYTGPLDVKLEAGDGLRFADTLNELKVEYKNPGKSPVTVTIEEIAGSTASALSYYQFDPAVGSVWTPINGALTLNCPAGESSSLRLAIRRKDMTQSDYASVLRAKVGTSGSILIPVTATGLGSLQYPEAIRRRAGLWLGSATIDAVSEVHSANPTHPTPTRSTFQLRLLVHLDASGKARLLKEVTQMWKDGTYTNNASGEKLVHQPGRYVLLTDDSLIGQFSGATLRDGAPVGRRLSSMGYDFPSRNTNNFLLLSGQFDFGKKLTGTLTMPHDAPTNPYKHRFHPDHDNLNVRFDEPAVEDFETSRQIELEFTTAPPQGAPPSPDYGYSTIGGVYRETIGGLHKTNLFVRGGFVLNRISLVSDLNPSPNP